MLRHLDLFSGIGGFSLGLESTGFFKTIGFVEKDKHCQQVLKKHWNNINIEEDIRNVKGERYKTDVITGGFPCQPFSVAGKRKGTDDDRYLWDEMFRVIRETKPRWVIGENVDGIININNGLVLRQVQTDLEKEGFQVQCLVIPAAGIGAWHQRKRVWIICNSKHNGLSSTKIRTSNNKTNDNCKERQNQTCELEKTSRSKNNGNVWLDVSNSSCGGHFIGKNRNMEEKTRKEKEGRNQSSSKTFDACSNVSNPCSFELNGRNNACRTGDTEQYRVDSDQKEEWNKVWSEAERCSKQGTRRTWWQIESELRGIPNGVSTELHKDRTQRLKMLGNSIVPQIARQLGLAIMKAENGN
jgi:DNA (cytosine-5)-methyltransferase 1